jgi:hypothetical protein
VIRVRQEILIEEQFAIVPTVGEVVDDQDP